MEVQPTEEVASMYNFAVVALLGLAAMAVIDFVEELVPGVARVHRFATFALGVVVAVALNYSMFTGFHVAVRETWMGTWGTGLVIGSLGTAWRALFGYLGYSEGADDATERHHGR